MCLVGDGRKGDCKNDEQQGRRTEQTSHSVSPHIVCGSGMANGWGSTSPKSAERRENSVIIASPFITSEVSVGSAFTLFSLSPTRVEKTPANKTKSDSTFSREGPSDTGFRLWQGVSKDQAESPEPNRHRPYANVSLPMTRQSTHQTK